MKEFWIESGRKLNFSDFNIFLDLDVFTGERPREVKMTISRQFVLAFLPNGSVGQLYSASNTK